MKDDVKVEGDKTSLKNPLFLDMDIKEEYEDIVVHGDPIVGTSQMSEFDERSLASTLSRVNSGVQDKAGSRATFMDLDDVSNTEGKHQRHGKRSYEEAAAYHRTNFKVSTPTASMMSTIPASTMSNKKSDVWLYFARTSKDEAQCLICHKILKSSGGSTSSLKTHIIKIHAIDFESKSNVPSLSKRRAVEQMFILKKSVDEAVVKMACKDGLSFGQIASSEFIQSNLATNDYDRKPPSSGKEVKSVVLNYYENKKRELADYFSRQIKAGFRYSISLDQYTAFLNRRFIHINVHGVKKHWSLGLVCFQGSLSSRKMTEVLKNRLNEYGLNLNGDIVGVTSNGSSVMVKFCLENELIHQLCLAHGTHLSVCDVLYEKNNLNNQLEEETDKQTVTEEGEENAEIIEDWDDYDIPLGTAFEAAGIDADINVTDFIGGFGKVISKVRKLCDILRKSFVKNDYLQEIIRADSKGNELKLLLNTRRRWSSMTAMISRFVELKNCIPRALRVCGITEGISDDEWNALETLLHVLRPFEIALKGLSTEDASLLKGENSMKFILKELENQNCVLATKLEMFLIEQYSSRRLKDVIGLIRYLEDPEVLERNDFKEPFLLPSHEAIERLAETTFNRLFPSDEEAERQEESDEDVLDLVVSDPMIQRYLTEVASKNKPKVSSAATFDLTKEMKLYEATGKRSERLEQLYRSLSTIRAASIESERAFASTGYFVPMICPRLSPKTLNAFSFLRSYFSSAKK